MKTQEYYSQYSYRYGAFYILPSLMKKLLAILASVALLASALPTFAQTNATTLEWLYGNGLTKYNDINEFRPNDSITRGEMSKFVTKYAEVQGLTKNYTQCNFNDIAGYDPTLEPTIIEACEYGLLKGSGNTYNPNGNVTEAQAITVVIRSLWGFLDETGAYRRQPYYEAGRALGIITGESLLWVDSTNITRIKMGKWFYLAAAQSAQDVQGLDGEEQLRNILQDIFGDIQL